MFGITQADSTIYQHTATLKASEQVSQVFCLLFQVLEEGVGVAQLVEIFCTEGYNKRAKLHYLGPLLSNLTQLPDARNYMLDKDR